MKWVVGIDEVGRGPIAGPVAVCATVILKKDYRKIKHLNFTDSKKMSIKNREAWYKEFLNMKKQGFIGFCVSYQNNAFIDKYGISKAIQKCIETSLSKLNVKTNECQILLDGSLLAPVNYKNQKTIIKGDQKEKIISMSSVIAKVSRDKKMKTFSKKYNKYFWEKNSGYGTKEHYRAIDIYGLTPLHRKSFLNIK